MNFVEATDREGQNAQDIIMSFAERTPDGTRRAFNPKFLLG